MHWRSRYQNNWADRIVVAALLNQYILGVSECFYYFAYLAEETYTDNEKFTIATDCKGTRVVNIPKRDN